MISTTPVRRQCASTARNAILDATTAKNGNGNMKKNKLPKQSAGSSRIRRICLGKRKEDGKKKCGGINLGLFWTGVLAVFASEVFFVALMSYISSHFFVDEEEEDDAGNPRKHD